MKSKPLSVPVLSLHPSTSLISWTWCNYHNSVRSWEGKTSIHTCTHSYTHTQTHAYTLMHTHAQPNISTWPAASSLIPSTSLPPHSRGPEAPLREIPPAWNVCYLLPAAGFWRKRGGRKQPAIPSESSPAKGACLCLWDLFAWLAPPIEEGEKEEARRLPRRLTVFLCTLSQHVHCTELISQLRMQPGLSHQDRR